MGNRWYIQISSLAKPWYEEDNEVVENDLVIPIVGEEDLAKEVKQRLKELGGMHDTWLEIHILDDDLPPKPEE